MERQRGRAVQGIEVFSKRITRRELSLKKMSESKIQK